MYFFTARLGAGRGGVLSLPILVANANTTSGSATSEYNERKTQPVHFVQIRGDVRARLHTVIMSCCEGFTDAAFVHLRGIHALIMLGCNRTFARLVAH